MLTATVQAKLTLPVDTGVPSSVSSIVTEKGESTAVPKAATPDISPVAGSIARPAGNPVADHVKALDGSSESDPTSTRAVASPSPPT